MRFDISFFKVELLKLILFFTQTYCQISESIKTKEKKLHTGISICPCVLYKDKTVSHLSSHQKFFLGCYLEHRHAYKGLFK